MDTTAIILSFCFGVPATLFGIHAILEVRQRNRIIDLESRNLNLKVDNEQLEKKNGVTHEALMNLQQTYAQLQEAHSQLQQEHAKLTLRNEELVAENLLLRHQPPPENGFGTGVVDF